MSSRVCVLGQKGARSLVDLCNLKIKRYNFVRVLAALVVALTACGMPDTGVEDVTELLVRDESAVTVASLDANVVAGEIYISAVTRPVASEVQFFIDDEEMSSDPAFVGVEVPFEFLLDTGAMANGTHTVTALITRVKGGSERSSVEHASFVVDNGEASTPATEPVSPDPDPDPEPDPDPDPNPEPDPEPEPVAPNPADGRGYSLRGDPTFSRSGLDADARQWHARLWAAIENPNQMPNAMELASSDNTHSYGRYLHQHVASLLVAFRATGDLALLDEVDALAQAMRSTLAPGWRGTKDGTDGKHDVGTGYLIWPSYGGGGDKHYGKDTWDSNEVRTHAMVAHVAYAFDLNRDLASPSGVDYGERADFWQEYLVDHFEAKWRARKGVAWPAFPFISGVDISATWNEMLKYHYYMWRLTGLSAYETEARRMTDIQFDHEFKIFDTGRGEAYVFTRGLSTQTDSAQYLLPTVYYRGHVKNIVEFRMDGWYTWAGEGVAERFATTLSTLIMDNGSEDFAVDIGGGVERFGIPPAPTTQSNPYGSQYWDRQRPSQHAVSPYALLAGYDPTGRVATIEEQVYERLESRENPTRVHIPAGLLVYHVMN